MFSDNKSIDDELRESFRKIYGDNSEAKAVEPETAVEAAPEALEKVVEDTPSQDRDESGKFVAKPKEPVATGLSPQSSASPKEDQPASAPAPEAQSEPVRDINKAPSSWRPAAKAAYEKLSPEIRAEVHRREGDFLKGQSNLLPDAHLGQSMRQVIDPYRMLIDAEGGTPERAVGQLLQTASILRMGTPAQKTQLLFQIAQQYGVEMPNSGTPEPNLGTEQPQRDPRVDQLFQYLQTQEQGRQAQQQQELEGVAGAWIAETDAAGKPLRPYLDDVMAGMNVRVPQIRGSDPSLSHKEVLQKAYEQETWAHPEIRSILFKEQSEQLEAKNRAENQERVNLAKKAASVNVPRRGSSLTPAKPGSMEETIRKEALRLGLAK